MLQTYMEQLKANAPLDDSFFAAILSITDFNGQQEILAQARQICREQKRLTQFNQGLNRWLKQQNNANCEHYTLFTASPLTLRCGNWIADDTGVYQNRLQRDGTVQRLVACAHPILPVKRLINSQTGEEKLQLAFYRDAAWKTIIVPCIVCFSSQQIVNLSSQGILVSSENARHLVNYLHDVVGMNQQDTQLNQALPCVSTVSQLGWQQQEFFPYSDKYICDTSQEFQHLYQQFHSKGERKNWYDLIEILRQSEQSVVLRMTIAASLSSVLLEPLGVQSYVLHQWGTTGFGKTVSLMLAMSIWGNPENGALTRTMNMTSNAMARTAAFLHNLPFAADELQQLQSQWTDLNSMILYLTEGMDRGRAKKEGGGIEQMQTWRNCFLFTGEQPIINAQSGGGARNRVLEVEVTSPIFQSGFTVANTLRQNYGWAGPEFIAYVQTLTPQRLQQRFMMLQKQIMDSCNTSDKQANSMAALLLADDLACESIFAGAEPLQVEDVLPYLQSNTQIDTAQRSYHWCCDWIARNHIRFQKNQNGEIWGRIAEDGSYALVNKTVLTEHLEQNGYNATATLHRWAEKGWLVKNSQGLLTHFTKVYGAKAGYIKVMLFLIDESGEEIA